MAPGESATVTADYDVTQAEVDAGGIGNTAGATGTPRNGTLADVSDPARVNIVSIASLTLSKTSVVTQNFTTIANSAAVTSDKGGNPSAGVSDSVVTSSSITYTITVANTGNAPAINVLLVDTVPAGTTVTANPDGGTVVGGLVTWNLGDIGPGQSVTVSLTVETN